MALWLYDMSILGLLPPHHDVFVFQTLISVLPLRGVGELISVPRNAQLKTSL